MLFNETFKFLVFHIHFILLSMTTLKIFLDTLLARPVDCTSAHVIEDDLQFDTWLVRAQPNIIYLHAIYKIASLLLTLIYSLLQNVCSCGATKGRVIETAYPQLI